MSEKRTIEGRYAIREAQEPLPGIPTEGWGVGEGPPRPGPLGGGYPAICTPFEFSVPPAKKNLPRDPILEELHAMGLPRVFLRVAEAIGAANFLTMWRIFDEEPACKDHGPSALRINLRSYDAWRRFQRNRFMEELFRAGLADAEVLARTSRQLRENMTQRHVARLRKNR